MEKCLYSCPVKMLCVLFQVLTKCWPCSGTFIHCEHVTNCGLPHIVKDSPVFSWTDLAISATMQLFLQLKRLQAKFCWREVWSFHARQKTSSTFHGVLLPFLLTRAGDLMPAEMFTGVVTSHPWSVYVQPLKDIFYMSTLNFRQDKDHFDPIGQWWRPRSSNSSMPLMFQGSPYTAT